MASPPPTDCIAWRTRESRVSASVRAVRTSISCAFRSEICWVTMVPPGPEQARLGAELLHRLLGCGDIAPQVGDLVGKPLRCPLRRLVLGVQLIEDVDLSGLVGALCRPLRAVRGEAGDDHPQLRQQIDLKRIEEAVDHACHHQLRLLYRRVGFRFVRG